MSDAHTPMVVAAARALCAIGAKKSGMDQEAYWAVYSDALTVEAAAVLNAVGAPELLEALQGLDEAYCRAGSPLTREERTEDRKRLIAARAAIAKATGGAQ